MTKQHIQAKSHINSIERILQKASLSGNPNPIIGTNR